MLKTYVQGAALLCVFLVGMNSACADPASTNGAYRCARMAAPTEGASWEQIEALFKNAPVLEMSQIGTPVQAKDFCPTRVRVGWTGTSLLVLAELTDRDVFNTTLGFNKFAYMTGDIFEIFLRPVGQESYWEFHITPANQLLQIKYPDRKTVKWAASFRDPHKALEPFKVWEPAIKTRVEENADKEMWRIYAEVPLAMIIQGEGRKFDPKEEWTFSFSRYDYTHGRRHELLSSTSPHKGMNFHHLDEWLPLKFAE